MVPIGGITLKPEQLSKVFGPGVRPAATLTFEAAVDLHLDILFHHSAAGTHRRELAADGSAQGRRDQVPVIDSVAITQEVTKEHIKF